MLLQRGADGARTLVSIRLATKGRSDCRWREGRKFRSGNTSTDGELVQPCNRSVAHQLFDM